MNKTVTILALSTILLAGAPPAQVAISEINFTPQSQGDDQWIELVNLGASKTDLSTWSLYQATQTPGRPGQYWFAFPAGAEIEPGKFLRVHWLAKVKPSTKTDIWTGNTVFHFLFGLKAEKISKNSGALALFNTQQNIKMNDPGVIQDWISWGGNGFKRESNAIQAGRWNKDESVTSPLGADSIALDYGRNAEPTSASAFFRDLSPTPLAHNHPNAGSSTYGTSCGAGNVNPPTLSVLSVPTPGNRDFGMRVDPTGLNQQVFFVFSTAKGDGSITFGPCVVQISPQPPIFLTILNSKLGATEFRAPIPVDIANGTSFVQALVLGSPADFGFSNGAQLDLGN